MAAWTCLLSVPVALVLVVAFGYALGDGNDLPGLVVCLAPVPVLFSASSYFSGYLVAMGRAPTAILSQCVRMVLPVALMAAIADVSVAFVAIVITTSEALRLLTLVACLYLPGRIRELARTSEPPPLTGLGWQSSAIAVGQLTPMINRTLLAFAGPVAVVSYEMADRIFSACNQFVTTGVLLRRIAGWARAFDEGLLTRAKIVRDLAAIGVIGAVLAFAASIFVIVCRAVDIVPDDWEQGFSWSVVLLCGLPAAVLSAGASRQLIVLGRQRTLLPLMVTLVLANVSLSVCLYQLYGAIGVVVGLTVARVSSAVLYFAAPIYAVRARNEKVVNPV